MVLLPRTGLYLLADPAACAPDLLMERVRLALMAGVRLVQWRDKGPLSQSQLDRCLALRRLTHEHDACLLINDRVDLALMCAADGVHLGQDDLPIDAARKLLPSGAVVGISTHNVAEARAAQAAGADYVGFGNVFGTRSKVDAPAPVGVAALAAVCRAVDIPVYAIGGVGPKNVAQVQHAGAAGGAVISAVLAADDVRSACRTLMAPWDEGPA